MDNALSGHYAVGYFEAWDLYSLQAVIETAEALGAPCILGFGGAVTSGAWLDAGGVEALAGLARGLAERAGVPTAVLFNEAQTHAQAMRGVAAGCNCVMLDSSHLPPAAHAAATRALVAAAHAAGAAVEAELGHLPTAGDDSEAGHATDPAEAARFVAATGVDALAVSIGNVHLLADGQAALDLDRLAQVQAAAPGVPLVLHGGTGLPAAAIRPVIERGVAKINYGTRLKLEFLAGVREALGALPEKFNVHDMVGSRQANDLLLRGQARVRVVLRELTVLYGSAGKA
ncbi:MAG: class II fructose-bisphosphate aldolase [Anaerolineales bacterium]|nr:class II fructose-bisphosphate aldolase [Anaerolineales bacterium]